MSRSLSSMLLCVSIFFFFNDTATTEIYTLSLHDALPISSLGPGRSGTAECSPRTQRPPHARPAADADQLPQPLPRAGADPLDRVQHLLPRLLHQLRPAGQLPRPRDRLPAGAAEVRPLRPGPPLAGSLPPGCPERPRLRPRALQRGFDLLPVRPVAVLGPGLRRPALP